MDTMTYVGLDLETSGVELAEGARAIQIGLAVAQMDGLDLQFHSYSSLLNPSVADPGSWTWNTASAEIHKIPFADVVAARPTYEVDEEARQWLIDVAGVSPKRRMGTIPVGFNVGAFDMPFVKLSLESTYWMFSRRTCDLNAICYAMDGLAGRAHDYWKTYAKEQATMMLSMRGILGEEHNAEFDALLAIAALIALRSAIAAGGAVS